MWQPRVVGGTCFVSLELAVPQSDTSIPTLFQYINVFGLRKSGMFYFWVLNRFVLHSA